MEKNEEDYVQKSRSIFNLINKYRANPREFAKYLENVKRYLDKNTNILSEPDKIQIQMVEGETVFNEAINFLRNLKPLKPFQWDDCLAKSAQEHVDDIGPKGLLLYQSSDGTEPEDRISKYGNFVESLGENIDFGPNDEIGVIVSLTLDDGEEDRPHRDNLFKNDYQKIGIACGPHQTEFQMCVMDFAYDFIPKGAEGQQNENVNNPPQENLPENQNNQSPYVKLSLDNDDYKNYKAMDEETKRRAMMENNNNVAQNNGNENLNANVNANVNVDSNLNELEQLSQQVKMINATKKVVKKTVEVTTKITYTYEDGSTKEVNEVKTHAFS